MQGISFFFWKVKKSSGKISGKEAMRFSTNCNKSKRRSSTATGNSIGIGTFKYEAFHVVLENQSPMEEVDDLFKSLKSFLIVGRILGVIPYSGVFKKSYTQLYY